MIFLNPFFVYISSVIRFFTKLFSIFEILRWATWYRFLSFIISNINGWSSLSISVIFTNYTAYSTNLIALKFIALLLTIKTNVWYNRNWRRITFIKDFLLWLNVPFVLRNYCLLLNLILLLQSDSRTQC